MLQFHLSAILCLSLYLNLTGIGTNAAALVVDISTESSLAATIAASTTLTGIIIAYTAGIAAATAGAALGALAVIGAGACTYHW